MQWLHILPPTLFFLQGSRGLISTVECPLNSHSEIYQINDLNIDPYDCTLVTSCTDPLRISNDGTAESSHCQDNKFRDEPLLFECLSDNGNTCRMKLKVTLIESWDFQSNEENPCRNLRDSEVANLLPFSGNCSLFYKCDWGSTVLFECPPNLHFNPQFRICDWPWQAQCDSSWIGCPRPRPQCPLNYSQSLYLPHPHLCDHFYQCEWGIPRLQTCPTGLHFSPTLNICDWPYKARCQTC